LKGYETVIMDMKGQDVIIDEGHTYYQETPASNGSGMTYGKSMSCVIELIKILKEIGCRIHVCTATMPTCLKNKIISILGEEDTQIVKLSEEEISSFNRHIIHTRETIDYTEIVERYKNGEKVLVVHNQINKAVDSFRTLRRMCDGTKLLLHSRFERGERAELENVLINELNKSSEPCIVVSTQVVEVSLDINFDVMFTDCADIMSLIQRFGRINRQRSSIGVYKDVFVINVNDGSGHLPYDANACKNTFDEFKKIDGRVLDENYIQTIIDNVHISVNDFKFELANPYDENGVWKTQKFCHTVGESVASTLEFVGCVAVRESNKDEYIRTRNIAFEIPISTHNKKWSNGITPIDKEKVGGKLVYPVPDSWYEKGIGLII
jgi:CRISPR-associated endonuclease/helicase Cas3